MVGTHCGQYRIARKLATGGMGEIFIGIHDLMGNEVVIKMLLPEVSVNREIAQRFFNEARTAANLDNPGIVRVFDMGFADNGRVYIAMEKLKGEDLAQRLRNHEQLSIEQSIRVISQLSRAVGAAHAQGIVHRDLKPENVFLTVDTEVSGGERVKVLDFGLAKLLGAPKATATRQGAVFGTPAYMAPEQCMDAGAVDHRADLYAIGCILYECVCGRPPFGAGGLEVIAAQLRDPPRPPREIDDRIPEWLQDIILRLLAKKPEDRISSCAALSRMLERHARQSAANGLFQNEVPAVAPEQNLDATIQTPSYQSLHPPEDDATVQVPSIDYAEEKTVQSSVDALASWAPAAGVDDRTLPLPSLSDDRLARYQTPATQTPSTPPTAPPTTQPTTQPLPAPSVPPPGAVSAEQTSVTGLRAQPEASGNGTWRWLIPLVLVLAAAGAVVAKTLL